MTLVFASKDEENAYYDARFAEIEEMENGKAEIENSAIESNIALDLLSKGHSPHFAAKHAAMALFSDLEDWELEQMERMIDDACDY